jgi:hypothetical protein
MSRLVLFLQLIKKFGDEIINVANIKKALARALTIFKPKRSVLFSKDWFLFRDNTLSLFPGAPGREKLQNNSSPSLLTGYHPCELFSLPESEVGPGWLLGVPRQFKTNL